MATTLVNYDGQIASTEGDIVAAVANPHIIKSIVLHNTTGGAITVTVKAKAGAGTPRILFSQSISANSTITFDTVIVLDTGDALRALDATGTSVDFWISGVIVT